ncbi:MAG TPA: helix-turn-helix transcriptional regulator [Fimbriimonadaceae bacterium]|nr:helix-turn-helix transcriptional regulator [Fimbriimonadaceae bacterium]
MAYKAELEALILGALRDEPLHGYRIALSIRERSADALKLGDNQVYPTLHRLEHEGLVVAEWHQQTGKPARKVYSLTPVGTARLEELRKEWGKYAAGITALIGGATHA